MTMKAMSEIYSAENTWRE